MIIGGENMKLKDMLPPAPHVKFYVEDYVYSRVFHEYYYEYLKDVEILENAIIEGDGNIWLIDMRFKENWEIITIVKMTDDEFKKNFEVIK